MFSRWQAMTIRIIIAGMILISTALAQSTNQAVLGLVSDSTGAVIQGAKVTLTNADTNVTQTVTTNETGNYSFPLIPVGNYDCGSNWRALKPKASGTSAWKQQRRFARTSR